MKKNLHNPGLHLGTQEITGSTDWEITAGKGIITRTGYVTFSIQYIQAMVVLSQSLDTRNHPQIRDIQFELGNIQVRLFSKSAGSPSSHSLHSFELHRFEATELELLIMSLSS